MTRAQFDQCAAKLKKFCDPHWTEPRLHLLFDVVAELPDTWLVPIVNQMALHRRLANFDIAAAAREEIKRRQSLPPAVAEAQPPVTEGSLERYLEGKNAASLAEALEKSKESGGC